MSDKRSVHTDALQTLGNIIDESGKRDAIHLAVEPCVAGEDLYPGQHIGIVGNLATTKANKMLGVVDPFIRGYVPVGKRFWLIVYPRQISSLRHVWEHPDFTEEVNGVDKKTESEKWLRDWCEKNDAPSYDWLMRLISNSNNIGEHSVSSGDQEFSANIPEEFWGHIENVLGNKIKERPEYFSCAC